MVPADSFPEGWPCCAPSFVLETLHELEKEECPQEKKFYSTYAMKWEKLDMEKRQKTFVFFSKLDSSVKMTISAKATEKEKLSLSAARTENNVTTKHDKSRVLHLFADPRLVLDWQDAYSGTKDRLTLDDPQAESGWNALISAFNNSDDYSYKNECLVFMPSTGTHKSKPGMEAIYNFCHDLNPAMPGRPQRDISWLRDQMLELRKQLTKVYDNYKRSGQQDAENKYDEWAKFCNSSPSPVLYSICVLDETKLSTYLGKEMPEGVAMDTGELTKKRALSSKESAKKRREQRLRAKKKAMSTNDDVSTIDGSDDSSHNVSRIYALKVIANLTTSEDEKRSCLDALRSLAGLPKQLPNKQLDSCFSSSPSSDD